MLSLSLLLLAASAAASNVLDLGPDNFDTIVGKGKPGLVELCVTSAKLLKNTMVYQVLVQLRSVVWSLQSKYHHVSLPETKKLTCAPTDPCADLRRTSGRIRCETC